MIDSDREMEEGNYYINVESEDTLKNILKYRFT